MRKLCLVLLLPVCGWTDVRVVINHGSIVAPRLTRQQSLFDGVEARQRTAPKSTYVVGAIDDGKEEVASYGPDSNDSLFEIGSISKTFTGLVLVALANDHILNLDDTVGLHVTELEGTPLGNKTLRELATHSSGLPENFANYDPRQPYPNLSEHDFIEQLRNTALSDKRHYSDIAFALIGIAFSRATGKTFAGLLKEYVTDPLKMNSTTVTSNPNPGKRMPGTDWENKPAPAWNIGLMDAMGGVLSTSHDMQTFVRALLNPPDNVAGRAITKSESSLIGWDNITVGPSLRKIGETGGFASVMEVDPKEHRATFILTNSADEKVWDFPMIFGYERR